MITRYPSFVYTFLLLFVFLSSLNILYAQGTISSSMITLDMAADDKNELPTGPTPATWPRDSNGNKYDPSTAKTFDFNLTGFPANEYYEIEVKLEFSNKKGFATNFGNNDYNDLALLKSDYVEKVNKKNTYPLK